MIMDHRSTLPKAAELRMARLTGSALALPMPQCREGEWR